MIHFVRDFGRKLAAWLRLIVLTTARFNLTDRQPEGLQNYKGPEPCIYIEAGASKTELTLIPDLTKEHRANWKWRKSKDLNLLSKYSNLDKSSNQISWLDWLKKASLPTKNNSKNWFQRSQIVQNSGVSSKVMVAKEVLEEKCNHCLTKPNICCFDCNSSFCLVYDDDVHSKEIFHDRVHKGTRLSTLREEILAKRNFGEWAHSPILVQVGGIYFGELIKFLNLARINFGERPIFWWTF